MQTYSALYSYLKYKPASRRTLRLPRRESKYYLGLSAYASNFIRPLYDLIADEEGLVEFLHFFLVEYSETSNEQKKLDIETIIFPLYCFFTKYNYDTNYLKAWNIEKAG